jgi:hypothetical protein
MPGDPEECRGHAKRCQAIADESSSLAAKNLFQHLAKTWIRIANDHERAKALLKTWGDRTG